MVIAVYRSSKNPNKSMFRPSSDNRIYQPTSSRIEGHYITGGNPVFLLTEAKGGVQLKGFRWPFSGLFWLYFSYFNIQVCCLETKKKKKSSNRHMGRFVSTCAAIIKNSIAVPTTKCLKHNHSFIYVLFFSLIYNEFSINLEDQMIISHNLDVDNPPDLYMKQKSRPVWLFYAHPEAAKTKHGPCITSYHAFFNLVLLYWAQNTNSRLCSMCVCHRKITEQGLDIEELQNPMAPIKREPISNRRRFIEMEGT